MRSPLAVARYWSISDGALLVLRFTAGLAFMFHGWSKIQNPMSWMGPEGFAPGVLQAMAAISEFCGGLAWILGLLTPLASLGIGCTMAVAVYSHAVLRGDPFVNVGGPGYELAAIYFCIALLLLAMGPGRLSLDRLLFGERLAPDEKVPMTDRSAPISQVPAEHSASRTP